MGNILLCIFGVKAEDLGLLNYVTGSQVEQLPPGVFMRNLLFKYMYRLFDL